MSAIKDALEKARSDVQELHLKIEAARLKHDIHKTGEQAKHLAETLRAHVNDQHADVKQHVHDAVAHSKRSRMRPRGWTTRNWRKNKAELAKKAKSALHSIAEAIKSAA